MYKNFYILKFYYFLTLILILLNPVCTEAAEKVKLKLKWQHQFQFAGYYAAQERGYYKEAGLDVEIIPSQPGEDSAQTVLQGKAEFGVGSTELLLLREQGRPVVVLGVIFQHSPLAMITLKKNNLHSIHDLAGQKIMIEPGSSELYAYLNKEGLSSGKFTPLPHDFHIKDLLAGNVDAMSVYTTDEPFELSTAGIDYSLYSPRSAGIDFYGDNIFTTEDLIKRKPEMVNAFREASLKGWEYAMNHPEELIQLIYSDYSQRHTVEHLSFEAVQMIPLLQPTLVELGHMNSGRWKHISETYAELGMMKPDFDLKGFLYDPNPPPQDMRWIYTFIVISILTITFISSITIYIYRINMRLRQEIAWREQTQDELNKSQKLASLGILAGGIAHNFNNVLSGIFGYIELASNKTNDPKVSEYLNKALNSMDKTTLLTEQLITFSKGGAPVRKNEMLFPFLEETVVSVLKESKITNHFHYPKDLWKCMFDRHQIKQVIENIILNAQQAMPNNGILIITAQNITLDEKEYTVLKHGNYVKISIKDNGIGIPEEILAHVFDPFFTTKSKGSGLGLATSYSIINKHGGFIDVESEQNKGSTFHIYLPASEVGTHSENNQ